MLIGINGFKGAGKSVVGEYLAEQYDFKVVSFAALLKQSAAALFGINPDRWEDWKNDDSMEVLIQRNLSAEVGRARLEGKDPPAVIPHVRMTVRKFLQLYGTESHRDVFGYDFWIVQAFNKLDFYEPVDGVPPKYVFTDARFENELAAIRGKGGKNIQILRPDTDVDAGEHASEVRPDDRLIDSWIRNTGTIDNLYDAVDSAISGLFPEIAQ